jgi:hypothetical protein
MKINNDDYVRLYALIKDTLAKYPTAQQQYKDKGLSRTRFLFDTFHVTVDYAQKRNVENYVWMRRLQERLNDNHLETALNKIVPEL